MTEYDNNLSGALFKNNRKREGKTDPDYQGQAEVGGVEYWLSAWINTSKKDGSKFMSLKFNPKETTPADFDDDIPF